MDTARAESAVDGRGRDSGAAHEIDRLAAHVAALSAELEAAQASAGAAAADRQADLERLHAELLQARLGLVLVQESVSWRVTRPLRVLGRIVRRRRATG